MEDDDSFRLSSYIHRTCGFKATSNVEEIGDDHTYIGTPNWKPDFVFSKPLRTLFVHPPVESICATKEEDDTIIDVESEQALLPPVYDVLKASNLMDECERHVNFQHPDEGNPNWEDHIVKINWTTMQTRLFHRVVRVLHSDRLARLAHQSHCHEPVLRRVTVDKTARRLRQIYASVAWQTKYTQWLHTTLIDNMHASYLVSYLDALQTLKSKVPSLIDRMLAGSSTKSALANPIHELLNIVHKRPWDPLSVGITHYKPKKLPQDPILVMVPSGPGSNNSSNSRTHHWMANLSALGTVVCVYSTPGRVANKTSVTNCLDHMLASTRTKVTELHADYGDKPIILVGIGTGATLACQVALVENVTAVVCLGFPMYTVEDVRGTPDDSLLNLHVPVLFVIGQNSTTCSVGDLEDMRDKLNIVTSLVVVGGGDDQLRLTKARKKLNRVTQSMVDKCIMDEVADFLGTLLAPGYVPPVKPTIHHSVDTPPKRTPIKAVERKRKCDSVIPGTTAPTPTPAKKGRKPKISMMQKMVENKWANQLPLSSSEVVSTPSQSVTLTMGNANNPVVLEKKGNQYSIQPSKLPQPVSSEGTITVVAATTPTLTPAGSVKNRLASGQLTSLSSILQPGTRGVLSPSSCKSGESIVTVTSSLVNNTPIIDELNILDMPVILGDQNPDELLATTNPTLKPKPSPVKLILTNTKPRANQSISTIKYMNQAQQPVKCTKIYIKKAGESSEKKTVYVGEIGGVRTSKTKPKIRNIPATKHSQFY